MNVEYGPNVLMSESKSVVIFTTGELPIPFHTRSCRQQS